MAELTDAQRVQLFEAILGRTATAAVDRLATLIGSWLPPEGWTAQEEWAVRYGPQGSVIPVPEAQARRYAEIDQRINPPDPATALRRTVWESPWEEA